MLSRSTDKASRRFYGWRGSSLSFRLTAWYTGAAFFLIVVATGILYVALSANLDRNTDLFLSDKVHVVAALLRDRPDDWSGLREEVELESAARRYENFYIRLLDQRGTARLATPGMDSELPPARFSVSLGRPFPLRSQNRRAFRALVERVEVGSVPTATWTMQVAVDLTQEDDLLARYRAWLWSILAIALVSCPLIGYQIARHGIHFVRDVTETARRIGSTTLNERIQPEGYPDELADLARTFNGMLDRLEEAFGRLSRFSADIAHELRTPVNNIRGEAEVALARARSVEEYREVVGSCLEEAVRLSELIGSLLFLARTENPATHIKRERVDLPELLNGVRDYYEGSAAENGISFSVNCTESSTTNADRALLQRAVANLVSNAIANTPAGGSIALSAHADPVQVRIEVADTGVGISAQDLPNVLDRFYRVDPARSQASGGTGLGLAIVKGIMNLHGGRVEIASTLGEGTSAVLVIPNQATR
jgi:two-component system heavy metal sensor histidine kinase CusS